MPFDFLENLGILSDGLDLLSNASSIGFDDKSKRKKKSKYFTVKVSIAFILISSGLLFLVFKDQLPVENYVQTLIVCALIGLAVALLFFFILYVLEKYYFKSVFQWLFFSCSAILFFVFCFGGFGCLF
jgi:hypothetical protein